MQKRGEKCHGTRIGAFFILEGLKWAFLLPGDRNVMTQELAQARALIDVERDRNTFQSRQANV